MPQAVAAVVTWVASALTTAGVGAGIAKVIATVAVNLAISTAVSAASSALSKQEDTGERLLDPAQWNQLTSDPLSDRVIIYGETGLAGEIVFQQVTADRASINYVIALADAGQVIPHTLTRVLMDGTETTFDVDGNSDGPLGDKLQVRFYGGTPSQTADADLITESGGIWTTDHRGRSCVYAIMRVQLSDGDAFPNGRPNPIFVIKGRAVYDPRLDSTKAGGSGSHRIDDESTWEWSDNAALIAYDYARGVYIDGTRVAGLGLPSDLIDESWVVASANACDEMEWTINGPTAAGSDPADVLKSFAVHMGGRIATRKGRMAIIAGYDWASSITIGENDLAGRLRIRHAKSWRDVHNAVKGTYRDTEANWEGVETNLVRVEDWITQDNGEVFEKTVTLPYCHDRIQSTRLAKLELYKKRAPRTIWAPVKLRCAQAIEGDFVDVEFPTHGIEETYEVVNWTLDQLGFATLELELWDAAGLTWSDAEAGDPVAWDAINRLDLTPSTPDVADWTATPVTVSKTGVQFPVIDVEGSPPSWIEAIVFEYRVAGDSIWTPWTEVAPTTPTGRLYGVLPLEDYEISVRYRFHSQYSARLVLEATAGPSIVVNTVVNQGDLATLDTVGASALSAGVGKNCLLDSEFRNVSTFWRGTAQSGSASAAVNTSNGLRRYTLTGSGVTVGHYIQADNYPQRLLLPVIAGDYIEAYAYLGGSNVSKVTCFLQFHDAAGSTTGFSTLVDDVTPSAGGGELTTFERVGVIAQAPANTVRATLCFRGTASTAAPVLQVTKAYLGKASAAQTEFTSWNIGFDGEPGANITETRTAAAITGQGWGATASEANSSNAYVPGNGNALIDTDFNFLSTYWPTSGNTTGLTPVSSVGVTGSGPSSVRYIERTFTGTPANNSYNLICSDSSVNVMRVTGGERFEAQALVAGDNIVSAYIQAVYLDAAGSVVGGSYVTLALSASVAATSAVSGASGWTLLAAFATAPAGARSVWIRTVFNTDDSLPNPKIRFARPLCRVASATQSVYSAFEHGFRGEPGANITETRTAAAITSQGSLATLSAVTLGTNIRDSGGNTITDDQTLNVRASFGARKTWTFESGDEGFTASKATVSAASGVLTLTPTLADPNLISPAASPNLVGRLVPKIRARIRFTTGTATWDGTIFYETAGHSYSASYYKTISQPPGWAVNQWVIVEWDMSSLSVGGSDWTSSTITRVRFDIVSSSTGTVEIDWITFGDWGFDPVTTRGITDNADQTSVNTAAAITGQGWGATASEANASNANVPVGSNAVVNSEFALGSFGWSFPTSNTTGLSPIQALNQAGYSGNRNAVYAAVSGSPAASSVLGIFKSVPGVTLSDLKTYALPVVAGERIYLSAKVGMGASATGISLIVVYYTDASTPVYVSDTAVAFGGSGSTGVNGDPANFSTIGGYHTVPATAKFAVLLTRWVASGGANPYGVSMDHFIARVPANQTATIPYSAGRENPLGDQTSVNTAAAIASQGSWATRSNLNTNGGASGVFDVVPYVSRTVASLTYQSCVWTGPSGAISVTGGTLSGLSTTTKYHVFWDVTNSVLSETSDAATAAARYADTTGRWLGLGAATTGGAGSSGGGGGAGGVVP